MIKVNVEVNSKSWHKKIQNPKKYFGKKLKKISKIVKFFNGKNITFTILLTSSLNMKKLNKKFRNQNKSTDVLSFPFLSSSNLKFTKQKKFYIGDVATSYEIISSRSKKNNFFLEFDKAWIHGLLHLIGYNHINNKDYFKTEMLDTLILGLKCCQEDVIITYSDIIYDHKVIKQIYNFRIAVMSLIRGILCHSSNNVKDKIYHYGNALLYLGRFVANINVKWAERLTALANVK